MVMKNTVGLNTGLLAAQKSTKSSSKITLSLFSFILWVNYLLRSSSFGNKLTVTEKLQEVS